MTKLLGKNKHGQQIDLNQFVDHVCRNYVDFNIKKESLLANHPGWHHYAQDAVDKFALDFISLRPPLAVDETVRFLNIPPSAVSIANSYSIVMLFGLAHFLNWKGYNIENPTSFTEISKKLIFARKAAVLMGYLFVGNNKHEIITEEIHGNINIISKACHDGFLAGLSLGYLIDQKYHEETGS